jgi:hypothetical protein
MAFGISLGGGKSKSSTAPWAPQQSFLKNLWQNSQDLYTRGTFDQNWYAGPSPEQLAAIEQGAGVAPYATEVGQQFTQAGQGLMPGLGSAFDYFGSTLGGVTPYSDPNAITDYAGQFAETPYTQDIIAASLRDPFRQLTEQQLPGIAMNAAATGTSGGSRRAIADSIAQRGFADRAADVSAGVYQQNMDRGYNFADRNASAGMDQANMGADALMRMGQAGLGYIGSGLDYSMMAPEMLAQWGGYDQSLRQGQIDADRERFMSPWDLLGMQSNIVQAGNWGGTTTSSAKKFGFTGGWGGE